MVEAVDLDLEPSRKIMDEATRHDFRQRLDFHDRVLRNDEFVTFSVLPRANIHEVAPPESQCIDRGTSSFQAAPASASVKGFPRKAIPENGNSWTAGADSCKLWMETWSRV